MGHGDGVPVGHSQTWLSCEEVVRGRGHQGVEGDFGDDVAVVNSWTDGNPR